MNILNDVNYYILDVLLFDVAVDLCFGAQAKKTWRNIDWFGATGYRYWNQFCNHWIIFWYILLFKFFRAHFEAAISACFLLFPNPANLKKTKLIVKWSKIWFWYQFYSISLIHFERVSFVFIMFLNGVKLPPPPLIFF